MTDRKPYVMPAIMYETETFDGTVNRLFEELYQAYGSDTGHLFGIPPEHKPAVKAIVKALLNSTTISEWRDAADAWEHHRCPAISPAS